MLDRIREGSQGAIAKGILGFVVLTFAISGVSSYFSSSADTTVAVVNGEEVGRAKFEQSLQNARNRMKQQFGDMFDNLAADPAYMANFRSQVLEQLIDETLFRQHAATMNLTVSDAKIKQTLMAMPEFQVDGKYDNDRYIAVLRQSNLTGEQLAEMMRNDMLRNQYLQGMSSSEFALPSELKRLIGLQQQTRDLKYLTVTAASFADKVTVEDKALQDWYQLNSQRYATPEQIAVQYVELKAADLAKDIVVSDADAQAYYDANTNRYVSEERRRVSHILLESADESADVKAKAEALLAQIQQGADFATLAKANSADTLSAENGGDLDFISRNVMEPEFEDAAFKLAKVGDVSAVVKTSFGYHIIKLTELEAAKQKPFADVKAEIIASLTAEKATERFHELQQKLAEVSYEISDSLDEAAKAIGVTVQQSPVFAKAQAPAALNQPRLVEALFKPDFIAGGINSDVIDLGDQHIVVARVTEHQPAKVRAFDEVKADVRQAYVAEQSAELAQKAVADALAAAQSLEESAKALKTTVVDALAVPRFGGELNSEIRTKAFELARPAADKPSIGQVKLANGDSVLVAVTAVKDVDITTDPSAEDLTAFGQQLAQSQFGRITQALREKAEITRHLPVATAGE